MQADTSRVPSERTADALYRRVTLRLLPFLMLCYMVAVIDRLNIAMAKLQMLPQLGFSEATYGLGAGVFFLGYLLFDVPSNMILHRVGARWWLGRIMITWGLVSAGTAFVTTPLWFYALRFLLGLAEAGFFAGLLLYAQYWFPASRRGRVYTLLVVAVPLAGVVGNPLAGWIMSRLDGGLGLAGWQWLFLLEGLPSVICGLLCFRLLDNRIAAAAWLSPAEKAMLQANVDADAAGSDGRATGFLASPLVWLMCLVCFAVSAGMYAVGFWMPTLVHQAGIDSPAVIGLYSAIPWLAAILPLLIAGRTADRTGERRWHVAAPLVLCAAALALSTTGSGLATSLVALTVATSFVLVALAQFWSLPSAILTGYGAAGGIALINSVGNLAGFFSPTIIGAVKASTGSTAGGVLAIAAVIALGGTLTLAIPRRLVDGTRTAPRASGREAGDAPALTTGSAVP